MTFYNLQQEVSRRATRDQAGIQFDTAIKNAINASIFRTSREAPWRVMRRRSHFKTKEAYSGGSGAGSFTLGNSAISVTGATFLTQGIQPGRRIKLSGDGTYHYIRQIASNELLYIDNTYSATASTTTGTYSILGQEEYNLPIQSGHRMFLWHEAWGYPYKMHYITDQDFFDSGAFNTQESIPTHYRMWGEDMVIEQVKNASALSISSSSSDDKSVSVTVFGMVAGFPDYETIITNSTDGTTAVAGSKSFQSVERVVKSGSTVGRITVTANAATTTVAVLPVGDTTVGITYRKVQLYPLPNGSYEIFVQYYKDPYKLVNDTDVHELGEDFDEAIILLATSKIKGETEIKFGTETFFGYWKDEIQSLKRVNADKIDAIFRQKKPWQTRTDPMIHPQLPYKSVGAWYGPRVR